MSAPLRDPKELTEWLELDYADRPRGLRRWTRRLVWAALGLAGLFALWALWPRHHTVFEAGPVSTAHAMFNDNCAACHTKRFQTLARLWPTTRDARSVPDSTCLCCHQDVLPHNKVVGPEERSCAACHHEHRGRSNLARVPDAYCTSCHANLQGHFPKTGLADVTGFPGGHPKFRWWDGHDDPGTVRFNHKVHLAEGGVLKLDRKQLKAQWCKEDAPNGPLDRPPPERVWLKCDDCHRPDDAGRYMKPISFEQHCKDCHPLSVQITGELKGVGIRKAAADFALKPAPHREPEAVRAEVRSRYTDLARQFKHDLFGLPAVADPGEPPRLPWRPVPPPLSKQEWDWSQGQLQTAERVLFTRGGGCAYCHTVKKEWKSGDGKGPDVLPEYEPSRINTRSFELPDGKAFVSDRWLPQSRFNHAPHRILQCTECHKAETSTRTSEVLMPAIDNCMSCHNPRAGARSDCTECHPYHPREGRHAWKTGGTRRPPGTRTIEDVLRLGGK